MKNFLILVFKYKKLLTKNYIFIFLKLLFKEKLIFINTINFFIVTTITKIICMKKYSNCYQQNIKNQKQIYSVCKIWLSILAEIQKEKEVKNNIID